jgi:DNA mismatch repair protein MutS
MSNELTEQPVRTDLPPMLVSYCEYKETYPDALLFFQVGDFYEVFFEDAKEVASLLNLTLTSRDKNAIDPIPMCGVPVAVIDNYLQRLVLTGKSAVIVSQQEVAKDFKGMVPRYLERIVTPGVNVLGSFKGNNKTIIATVYGDTVDNLACVFGDVADGRFYLRELTGIESCIEFLSRITPTEIIWPRLIGTLGFDSRSSIIRLLTEKLGVRIIFRGHHSWVNKDYDLASFRISERIAVGMLFSYLEELTIDLKTTVASIERYYEEDHLVIDSRSLHNLEIVSSPHRDGTYGTLINIVANTKTDLGYSKVVEWIKSPLRNSTEITFRHDAVEELITKADLRTYLQRYLSDIVNINRIITRAGLDVVSPKEVGLLRNSLRAINLCIKLLDCAESKLLKSLQQSIIFPAELLENLEKAFTEDLPLSVKSGSVIKEGYDNDLDTLRRIVVNGNDEFTKLLDQERVSTGVTTLKLKSNNILGFFFEISNTHRGKLPERFISRQLMVNCERFFTDELKSLEKKFYLADEQLKIKEYELYIQFRNFLKKYIPEIRRCAEGIAQIDVLVGFATISIKEKFVRPVFDDSIIDICDGVHPVLGTFLRNKFIPNSLTLGDGKDIPRIKLITGPNMGGKSTFLRQIAHIIIMAQAGCFVPAKSARLTIVDRLFARIGASDNLLAGESTFMVEMREAANILNGATSESIILIDEIGRGTATSDGMAIAQAILEYLVDHVKCRGLFATHYHNLTKVAEDTKSLGNLCVAAVKDGGKVFFTHKINQGFANDSYGLEVAKLAGLPKNVVVRANNLLKSNGKQIVEDNKFTDSDIKIETEIPSNVLELIHELTNIDCNMITPLSALSLLAKLQNQAKSR